MHGRLIKWTAIVFVLLAGVLYIGKMPYDQILRDEVRARHQQLIKTADILIQEKLLDLEQDAYRLSLQSAVSGYLDAPTVVRRTIMQRALIDASNAYPRYAKIRYIDRAGMEQMRVNAAPRTIPRCRTARTRTTSRKAWRLNRARRIFRRWI
ncbi:hypothetical protein [Halomonas cibimaris]